MIRRSSLLALEVALGLLATFALAVGLFWWRLSAGPIELPALTRHVEAELSRARDGRSVTIEKVELGWGPRRASLELKARGVRALDTAGEELTRSEQVIIGVSLKRLIVGRIALENARFIGGDVTVTLKKDGASEVAFGRPGGQPDIRVPPPPPNETLTQRVNRILDGLAQAFGPIGAGRDLRAISITGAQLFIIDEAGGGRWRGDGAGLDLQRDGERLTLSASARLKGERGPAPFSIAIATDTGFKAAQVNLKVSGVQPEALAPRASLGPLRGLRAPLTATMSAVLDRKAGVRSIKGDVAIGAGVFESGEGRLRVSGGRVRGYYDLESDALLVQEIQVAGLKTRIEGQGRVERVSGLFGDGEKQPARFTLDAPRVDVTMPGVFPEAASVKNIAATGLLRLDEGAVEIETFEAAIDGARLRARGRVFWGPDGGGRTRPGVKLDAEIQGAVAPATVLRFWPLGVGGGARSWLAQAVQGGTLRDASLRVDFKPADLRTGPLPDRALTLKFSFDDAQVRYLTGMTPISEGRGEAALGGNSFNLKLQSGKVGPLALTAGRVEIPYLSPKGAEATYAANAAGEARAMIDLLRQAPIGLNERLPFDPQSIVGNGEVDFAIRRILGGGPGAKDKLRFAVDGRIEGAGASPKEGGYTISDWRLAIAGDDRKLALSGPLTIGQSRVDLAWTEHFQGRPKAPSQIVLRGPMLASDLVKLGYGAAGYASGPIGVEARAEGVGLDVSEADVALDLGQAGVVLPAGFWRKPAGAPATVRMKVARGPGGRFDLRDLRAQGAGLLVNGALSVTGKGDILTAELATARLSGSLDGRVAARRNAAGALAADVSGKFLALAPFFEPDPYKEQNRKAAAAAASGRAGEAGRLSPAIEVRGEVERMRLRGGAEMGSGVVDVGFDGTAITRASLTGAPAPDKSFAFAITPTPDRPETGRLSLKSDDAGFVVRAFTGSTNVRGGRAEASGTWRFGAVPSANVLLKLNDFQLVKMPAMATLLSSVASMRGLAGALNGEGIAFSGLEAPMTLADNTLTLGECRAAGPSLGITAKGAVDLDDGALDIDGVIIPSYGLNSVLGGVPILGDLLVSRKGEGVFGITYSVEGLSDKPRVGVNPLSVMAPGILRRIFEPLAPSKPKKGAAKKAG